MATTFCVPRQVSGFSAPLATLVVVLAVGMGAPIAQADPPVADPPQAEAPPASAQDQRPKDVQEATQPAHRPQEGWKDRNALINQRAKENKWDLVFMGDSITQGWEKAGREVWKEHYAKRKAGNLGIGGDQTQHLAWRIQNGNLAGQSPRLGVVMIGTNNFGNQRHSPEGVIAGIEKVLATYKEQCPQSQILLLGIFPRGEQPDHPLRAQIKTVNEQISKLADQKQIHYLDIGQTFLEEDGTLSKKVMPDFLHLSPEGYERWAKAIEPTLKKLLDSK